MAGAAACLLLLGVSEARSSRARRVAACGAAGGEDGVGRQGGGGEEEGCGKQVSSNGRLGSAVNILHSLNVLTRHQLNKPDLRQQAAATLYTTPRITHVSSPAVLLAVGVVLGLAASGTTTWACLGAALLLPLLGLARADLGGAAVVALLLR